MEFKLVPHQNTFTPSFEDIKKDPMEKESMLDLFIKWYSENVNKDIIEFVQNKLFEEKDDLYFSELKVNFEEKDLNTIMSIIDALGVKFYQKVILFLDMYFNANHEIFIMEADEKNSCYKMSYRPMNIMEIENIRKGQLNINAKA